MTKLMAILTGAGLFFGKVWKIIKSASKLKKVKKELMDVFVKSKETYENAEASYKRTQSGIKEIMSFFSEDSEGGKRLTPDEIKKATEIIKGLSDDIKEIFENIQDLTKEGIEAKDLIMEIVNEFKNKK